MLRSVPSTRLADRFRQNPSTCLNSIISPIYRKRIVRDLSSHFLVPTIQSKLFPYFHVTASELILPVWFAMGSAVSISAADLAAGIGSTILAVQLLTPADPLGKTWQLIRQFRKQVRTCRLARDSDGLLKKSIYRDQVEDKFYTATKMLE